MKKKLAQYVGQTLRLTGIFNEITYAKAARTYSILIKPVFLNGHYLCDHAWISFSTNDNPLKNVELNRKDEIRFTATVEEYVKSGDVKEFGLKDMCKVELVKRGDGYDYLSVIQNFNFPVKAERKVKSFGGESRVMKQELSKPLMQGIYLKAEEEVTCEFVKVHKDSLEFRLRTRDMREGWWIKKVTFNPMKNGQSISIRGYFSIMLPPQLYSDLKRAYFKIFCTKTEVSVQAA